MRELFVNGEKLDLDENTAIGITYQAGDVSEPCKNKLNITNSFEVPFTAKNKRMLGFSDSPFSSSNIPYEKVLLTYYDSNIPLLQNVSAFLSQTNKNYQISVIKGQDIISLLKHNDNTLKEWIMYDCISPMVGGTGFIGDIYYSDPLGLSKIYDDLMETFGATSPQIEFVKPVSIVAETPFNFTFGIKLKSLLEWIETIGLRGNVGAIKYKTVFNGTTSQITDFEKLILPYPFLAVEEYPQLSGNYGVRLNPPESSGINSLNWLGLKTLFDLFKSLCVLFNAFLDIDEKTSTIKITTFNKIIESNSVIDWSKKIVKSDLLKKFSVGSWVQNNNINYKYDDAVNTNGGKVILSCNNLNLESKKDYDNAMFVYRSLENVNNDVIYYLGSTSPTTYPDFTQKGIEEFCLFKMVSLTNGSYPIPIYQVYPLNFTSNYDSFVSVLQNPVTYELDLNLNILDIYQFSNENLVKIDQLGGVFYVNKINGFNSKSKKPTKVELIKVR